jgi:hypothetical protein
LSSDIALIGALIELSGALIGASLTSNVPVALFSIVSPVACVRWVIALLEDLAIAHEVKANLSHGAVVIPDAQMIADGVGGMDADCIVASRIEHRDERIGIEKCHIRRAARTKGRAHQ